MDIPLTLDNGTYSNPNYGSVLKQLISMGVHDENKLKQLPQGTKIFDLEKDMEVQTAGIYTHLDVEYDPSDIRKKVWDEYTAREDNFDNIEYQKKEGPKAVLGASLNKLIDLLLIDTEQSDPKLVDTFLLTYRSFT